MDGTLAGPPAAVTAWAHLDHGLRRPQARAVLAAGPTAALARSLTPYRLAKILTQAGRTRLVDDEAYRLRTLFDTPVLRLPAAMEQAHAVQIRTMLALFDGACTTTDELTEQLQDALCAHPHAPTYLTMPGCGPLTGARLLACLGDDTTRFATAKGLLAYAGVAPLTWASGSTRQVTHRRICNRRLKATCIQWAFSTLTRSPGCRALYDRRRTAGDTHAAALRRLAGRLLTCLRTDQTYREDLAFGTPPTR